MSLDLCRVGRAAGLPSAARLKHPVAADVRHLSRMSSSRRNETREKLLLHYCYYYQLIDDTLCTESLGRTSTTKPDLEDLFGVDFIERTFSLYNFFLSSLLVRDSSLS